MLPDDENEFCDPLRLTHQDYEQELKNYSRYLRLQLGLKSSSVTRYLDCFKIWTREITLLPSAEEILDFKGRLIERGKSTSTIRNMMYSVKHYMEYKGINYDRSVYKPPRKPKSIPHYLNQNEIEKLLKACDDEGGINKAMIYTLFYTGIRLGELQKLKISDVNITERLLLIRDSKNGEDDYSVIPLPLESVLREFTMWRKRRFPESSFLFVLRSRKTGHISDDYIRAILVKLSKKAGIKKVTPHMLRHSLASFLVAKGVNLSLIQKQLRHRDIQSTMVYLHMNKETLRYTLDSIFQLG